MNAQNISSFGARLATTTALVSLAFAYGARTSVRAGACTGAGGVYTCSGALNAGTDVTQTMSGSPVSVSTASGFGIDTYVSGGNALTLTGSGGLTFTDNNNSYIKGYQRAIEAQNTGSGNLTITTTGQVTGGAYGPGDSAISAYNGAGTNNLTISTSNVSGVAGGISAIQFGTGALEISSTGNVSAVTGNPGFTNGILADNPNGTSVTVDVHDVSGARSGIVVSNEFGAATVTSTGSVTGTSYAGISVYNRSTTLGPTTSVSVTANDVSGGTDGINVHNLGAGDTDIIVSGTATGTTGIGLSAQNSAPGTSITVNANNVYGGNNVAALRVDNQGSGDNQITITGTVAGGTGSGARGIETLGGTSTDTVIDLNAGAAVSSVGGFAIRNDEGTSTTTVNSGASVSGAIDLGDGDDNIEFAGSSVNGVSAIDGGADNDTLTLTNATGSINGSNITNVESVESNANSDVSFSGNLTTGTFTATNLNTGAQTVTSTGTIESTAGDGIDALNSTNSGDQTIAVNNVTGSARGINAINSNAGNQIITATGDITGATDGIRASNSGAGGYTYINTAGTVTGTADRGIHATATSGTTGLAIVTADVSSTGASGGDDGVLAHHSGSGDLSFTSTGTVSSQNADGVDLITNANAASDNMVVGVNNIYGDVMALRATHNGTGSMQVAATGSLTGGSSAVVLRNQNGTTLDLTVNDATGEHDGLFVRNYGSGATTITVNGAVTGDASGIGNTARDAIDSGGNTSTNTIINLNSGSVLTTTAGAAIRNDDGDSTINANAGSSITGSVLLNGGADNVIVDGADWSAVTVIDGGADTDSLTLRNVTAGLASGDIVNVEQISVDTGADVSLDGSFTSNVSVESGGQLSAGASPGQTNIIGDLDLATGSSTLVELAGLIAGSQYDQIDVTDDLGTGGTEGNANISNGAIFDIDFFGGFSANLGDMFDILIADTINSGTVENFTFDFSDAGLGGGLAWETSFFDAGGRDGLRLTVVESEAAELSEPSTLVMFGAGVLGIVGLARRRRRNAA